MENTSKLMMIGFFGVLFASAVLLALLMYYGVMDMSEYISHRSIYRYIMEGLG